MTTVTIHNVESGEIIERDMTPAELKQYEADQVALAKESAARIAAASAKKALLEKLGLTEEEAKLLLS